MKKYLNRIKFLAIFKLVMLISFFTQNANALIEQASSVKEIREKISNLEGEDTLILFDLDYVLFVSRDMVLRYAGEKDDYRSKHLKTLFKDFEGQKIEVNKTKISMAEYLISQILISSKVELVSPDMPGFVNELSSRKNTVIGFTANGSGKYGAVQSEAELYLSRLKLMGYHFEDDSSLLKKSFPGYVSRILFTNKADKGKILVDFLKHMKRNYKNVIFVDDRLKNLNSVQAAIKEHQINFLGIHYTELKDKNELLNHEIADSQFQILYKKHIWLDDNQVKAQLESEAQK